MKASVSVPRYVLLLPLVGILIFATAGCRKSTPSQQATTESTATIGSPLTETTPLATRETTMPEAERSAPPVAQTYADFDPAQRARADLLYSRHCSACHGEKGDGLGLAARFLSPKPRDFRSGLFRLVSTTNGVPTQKDIETVLVRGMPGSAMPPWPHLSDVDRGLLIERVIEFRREGIRDSERAMAAELDEPVDESELEELVAALTRPGPLVEVPELGEPTPEAVTRGRELYLSKGCASCHGPEGRGDGQQDMVDAMGLPIRARDLTRGIFKGSPDPESVYRRTQAGMPGSPMPAIRELSEQQIADLVHFVLSLSDDETRKAAVLNREHIVAARVEEIAVTPEDALWEDIPAAAVRLMPLWWRDEFPTVLNVQAVHDGESIALRLQWMDDEADTHAARSEAFEDAVAVELYRGEMEPFFGMGAPDAPLDVWMWDADRNSGGPDVDEVNPRLTVDLYPFSERSVDTSEYRRPGTRTEAQPDVSLTARASGNQIVPQGGVTAATSLEGGGPGTITFRPPINQMVAGRGHWQDGVWTVVMTRPLYIPGGQGGLSLSPGEQISAAFAVWDGAERDRDGKKLITIWQDLRLE